MGGRHHSWGVIPARYPLPASFYRIRPVRCRFAECRLKLADCSYPNSCDIPFPMELYSGEGGPLGGSAFAARNEGVGMGGRALNRGGVSTAPGPHKVFVGRRPRRGSTSRRGLPRPAKEKPRETCGAQRVARWRVPQVGPWFWGSPGTLRLGSSQFSAHARKTMEP
jgi:hypothetical protein